MTQTLPAETPPRDYIPMTSVGMASGGGHRLAPQNLAEVVKFAEVMSRAGIALPQHLQNNPGACMAVALQALDWQMNPFAVAQKSYSVSNRIAYEAQLIAAVVNTRSGIKGRLSYAYEGEGGTLRCIVTGVLDGQECTYETPMVKDIPVKNSPLWKSDPRQQLAYYGARSWARRHCPEVILGVYDRDEAAEMKDVTPVGTGLADRLTGNRGGFSAEGVAETLGEVQPIDWTNAKDATAALDAGRLPDGYSLRDDGALIVPANPRGSRGSSVIMAYFDHIVSADGKIIKSKNGPEHDPECMRAGEQAFVDGEERRAPDDFDEAQAAAWLAGFDATAEAMRGAP